MARYPARLDWRIARATGRGVCARRGIGGYGILNFDALAITEDNGDTRIDLTTFDGGTILVEGVTGLEAHDFAFG